MHFVFPKGVDTERYFLRLILTISRGPTLFTDFRTVQGIQYATYKDTTIALGLCESDAEWDHVMHEAALFKHPAALLDRIQCPNRCSNFMDSIP